MNAVEQQINETEQVGGSNEYPPVGKMTSKEKVLSVYPDAKLVGWVDGACAIHVPSASEYAKPSAEGDGWIAGFNAGIDAVIAAENDWNYFPVDMQRIAKLKRVPALPSGQGEKA